jgi:hypothetical protein
MFDGDAIEKWWKSALVFKVYSKTAGQKVVSVHEKNTNIFCHQFCL